MTTRSPASLDRSSEIHNQSSGEARSDARSEARSDDHVAPDALSAVLQDLRLTHASYCRTELHAPWGIEIPVEDGASLHVIVEGNGWLHTAKSEPLPLGQGDIVLLPQGAGHTIVDAPTSAKRPIQELPRECVGDRVFHIRGGGTGPRALMVCCGMTFEASALHPLLRMMPEVLHVPCGGSRDPVLSILLDTMAAEIREQRMGAATVMARLADIVVARVVRTWVEQRAEHATGWLAAIRDPQIGRALAAFHRNPERDWSVEALGGAAGLSRSQFSERFTAVLGVAPARYVAEWRMHLATRWLTAEHVSIGEVASRLGYDSEPSFSRAFKRIVGVPPGELRQR
jgi:AraC-like DNA-binding protein